MSGITVGIPWKYIACSAATCPDSRCRPASPLRAHSKCWILAREMGNVTVTPDHWVLHLVLLAQLLFQRSWGLPFRASQAKTCRHLLVWPCPSRCLYVFPACLFTLAVVVWMLCLATAFPGREGLCPLWALPGSSAPAGDLKHRLRVQLSTGLGVVVQASG